METERSKKKSSASQKSKTDDFSSKERQIEDIYTLKGLVGSIIEKGFSSSSSSYSSPSTMQKLPAINFPQPTVLSFPIARHRSHGPHWNPRELGEEEGEKEEMDYGPISSFANPIERKEKKGLNFSQWRNIVSRSDSAVSKPPEGNSEVSSVTFTSSSDIAFEEVAQESLERVVAVKRAKPSKHVSTQNREPEIKLSQSNFIELTASSAVKLSNSGIEAHMPMPNMQAFKSTMEDIHAENIARVNQMLPEEIVNAQTEIIEKMNPKIIEMLKKRGRDKLNNERFVDLGQERRDQDMVIDHLAESDNDSGKDYKSAEQVNSNSWKIWSERVEKVRELRFTIEGGVQKDDFQQAFSGVQLDVGNVAERDFLRTEGDPAALGYSIKEVLALIRSMVPAQRALALNILDSILNNALFNLLNDKPLLDVKKDTAFNYVDWQAIWAYALGPEPRLALTLRIALDDNHHSVVLACAKVIQSVLSCEMNDSFFDISEKIPEINGALCTAPIFRSRAEIDSSFLQGGFWKYATKASNIMASNIDNVEEGEEQRTIQDDIVVSGQDIAAGLVRMGILPRICYILEMEPIPALVESLVSVLIGLARHSPTCTNAIVQCPGLIQSFVNILTKQDLMHLSCQIKAITLLKVLSQMDKLFCSNFVQGGAFQKVMWQWYRNLDTINRWIESEKEHRTLTATLMVEQLRLWKVCISYGYCGAYFTDFFPNLCIWLSRPTFSKLFELDILEEFTHITREAYLTLGALAEHLPFLHSMNQLVKQDAEIGDDVDSWSWSHAVSMVELALSWLSLKEIPYVCLITHHFNENNVYKWSASGLIWVISAVMHMLGCIFDRISPRTDDSSSITASLPWLPEFVPKVGIKIIKNGFLRGISPETIGGSLITGLCYLRHKGNSEVSLSSSSCLNGLLRLVSSIDKCIQKARIGAHVQLVTKSSDVEGNILGNGIMKWAREELASVMDAFGNLVSSQWLMAQSLEVFGRGGPATGVGIGWGLPAGGFWTLKILLVQEDARVVLELFRTFGLVVERDITCVEEAINGTFGNSSLQRLNCVLAVCLAAGPGGRAIVEEALNMLFDPAVLKYLGLSFCHFVKFKGRSKPFQWMYEDEDYFLFSKLLISHFRERWLSVKTKPLGDAYKHDQNHNFLRKNTVLETILEDQESKGVSRSSFCVQWTQQRLPLPMHWFLSAICTIGERKNSVRYSSNEINLAKSGLFFLACLETLSLLKSSNQKPSTLKALLVWKLHALSMSLRANMIVLGDESSRDLFESLQELYSRQLDELRHNEDRKDKDYSLDLSKTCETLVVLSFQSKIDDGYTTFVGDLIEQFGAESYGNVIFARQVAIYLHRSVEVSVRLATWNALLNSNLIELLPPLEMCFLEAEGYLEPAEDNEAILEAYAKSWASGSLDKAFTRGSLGFSVPLHHLHSFFFKCASPDKLNLRNKLAKSILRSYSHKRHDFGMLLHLVKHKLSGSQDPKVEIDRRLELLVSTCDGNSSLIAVMDRLKSFFVEDGCR